MAVYIRAIVGFDEIPIKKAVNCWANSKLCVWLPNASALLI